MTEPTVQADILSPLRTYLFKFRALSLKVSHRVSIPIWDWKILQCIHLQKWKILRNFGYSGSFGCCMISICFGRVSHESHEYHQSNLWNSCNSWPKKTSRIERSIREKTKNQMFSKNVSLFKADVWNCQLMLKTSVKTFLSCVKSLGLRM